MSAADPNGPVADAVEGLEVKRVLDIDIWLVVVVLAATVGGLTLQLSIRESRCSRARDLAPL